MGKLQLKDGKTLLNEGLLVTTSLGVCAYGGGVNLIISKIIGDANDFQESQWRVAILT